MHHLTNDLFDTGMYPIKNPVVRPLFREPTFEAVAFSARREWSVEQRTEWFLGVLHDAVFESLVSGVPCIKISGIKNKEPQKSTDP